MSDPALDQLLNQRVVLDTNTPMVYIGKLTAYSEHGFWLGEADVHDRSEGHSTKEVYIVESAEREQTGNRRVNRRRVWVERSAVISVSALSDVVTEDETDDEPGLEIWTHEADL